MIGCYDFCAHYEWTFAWLEQAGGHALVRDYWNEAINRDSERHARAGLSMALERNQHCRSDVEQLWLDEYSTGGSGRIFRHGFQRGRCDHEF